jgi:hypothetical protein
MVAELKEVIKKVEQLNVEDQRMIAKMLDDELQWDNTLHSTQNKLAKLAREAIEEHQSGKTKQEDW